MEDAASRVVALVDYGRGLLRDPMGSVLAEIRKGGEVQTTTNRSLPLRTAAYRSPLTVYHSLLTTHRFSQLRNHEGLICGRVDWFEWKMLRAAAAYLVLVDPQV